jgi:pimeloyl-ACP methyl ester carboxylesterase
MLPRSIGSLHLDTIDVAEPTGAPVLCLHGLFAGAWAFERFLPLVAERGHPAAALSFRAHSPTTASHGVGRLSLENYVDDAATAAAALGRPIVVGHSLGGLVALLLAAHDLVRAAVLVSPAPPRGIPVFSPALLARMGRHLPALLLSRPFVPTDDDLDALVLNRVPPEERNALRRRFTPDSGRAAREAALGIHAVPAGAVRVPLLVVSGDDDRFVPLGVARKVARRYGAPLHVAPGHGHFLFAEPGWQTHAEVILDWIESAAQPARREPGREPRGAAVD